MNARYYLNIHHGNKEVEVKLSVATCISMDISSKHVRDE